MGSDAPEVNEPAPPQAERHGSARQKIVLGAVFAGAIAAGLLWFRKSEPPPVMALSPQAVLKHNPVPDRWIPRSWGWMWRARDMVLGKRRSVDLRARILEMVEPFSPPASLPNPTLVTNGVHVWILNSAEYETVGRQLTERIGAKSKGFNPVIRAADGVVATAAMGKTVQMAQGFEMVGFTFQALPIVRRDKTDLTFILKSTDTVDPAVEGNSESRRYPTLQTNLFQGLRVQIPKGDALGLLQVPTNGQPGCVILLKVDVK